jgi:hypothetical protein
MVVRKKKKKNIAGKMVVKAESGKIIVAEEMRGLHPEANCPFSLQL